MFVVCIQIARNRIEIEAINLHRDFKLQLALNIAIKMVQKIARVNGPLLSLPYEAAVIKLLFFPCYQGIT